MKVVRALGSRTHDHVSLHTRCILCDFGLAVEMLDFGEFAIGHLRYGWKTAPDEVFDAGLLAGVDDVLALCDLGGLVGSLPVIGHCENTVRALDG